MAVADQTQDCLSESSPRYPGVSLYATIVFRYNLIKVHTASDANSCK